MRQACEQERGHGRDHLADPGPAAASPQGGRGSNAIAPSALSAHPIRLLVSCPSRASSVSRTSRLRASQAARTWTRPVSRWSYLRVWGSRAAAAATAVRQDHWNSGCCAPSRKKHTSGGRHPNRKPPPRLPAGPTSCPTSSRTRFDPKVGRPELTAGRW